VAGALTIFADDLGGAFCVGVCCVLWCDVGVVD